jgi:hypothetical protein
MSETFAARAMIMRTSQRRTPSARAFSLVEMLLAVFILGIGVISIAALFPAGIALQRQASDDTVGPLVAKNAFATLRSKLSPDDFGAFQDFGDFVPFQDFGVFPTFILGEGPAGTIRPVGAPSDLAMISGDWGWMRPAFYVPVNATNNVDVEAATGTIDIFAADYMRRQLAAELSVSLASRYLPSQPPASWATEMPNGWTDGTNDIPLFGIPYNRLKYPFVDDVRNNPASLGDVPFNDPNVQALTEANITFTQAERSFPQGGSVSGRPTYYWECMFRRYGGKIQVAVFVYRVTAPGGEPSDFRVRRLGAGQLNVVGQTPAPAGAFTASDRTPPIPALYLAPSFNQNTAWPARGGLPTGYTAANGYSTPVQTDEIFGTHRGTAFAPELIWDDWQLPNSWWIDNHGSVHKVLFGRTRQGPTAAAAANEPGQGPVKLQRPIPIMPASPVNNAVPNVAYPAAGGPNAFIQGIWYVPQRDARGNILTPVYAAVEEL